MSCELIIASVYSTEAAASNVKVPQQCARLIQAAQKEHCNRERMQLAVRNVANRGTNANNLLAIVLLSVVATQDDLFLHQHHASLVAICFFCMNISNWHTI